MKNIILGVVFVLIFSAGASAGICGTGYGICNCGDTVVADYTMDSDLLNCPEEGLFIGANDITLNCNGHTVDGTDQSETYGIYLNDRSGNTIRNCTITDFYYGVYLENSFNNTMDMNDVSSNRYGVYLFSGSEYNTITNNRVDSNNIIGILLLGSNNNVLINNTANSNGGDGILLNLNSCNNKLINNTANSNNYGIDLIGSSDNNSLINNHVCSNTDTDIYDADSNSGDNNTCDKPDGWNDAGYIGCKWLCNGSEGALQTFTYIIQLSQGWNLISIPIEPTNASIDEVLKPIDGNYTRLYGWNASNPGWVMGLNEIHSGIGYWIYIREAGSLEVYGNLNQSNVSLPSGWDLIGWSSNESENMSIALSSIADNYTRVYEWNATTLKWSTPIDMNPGRGYWIYMKNEDVLEF